MTTTNGLRGSKHRHLQVTLAAFRPISRRCMAAAIDRNAASDVTFSFEHGRLVLIISKTKYFD